MFNPERGKMIRCAIVEQKDFEPKGRPRKTSDEMNARFSFEGSAQFGPALTQAVRHLFGKEAHDSAENVVNLLVIRAHGEERTGTELIAGNGERISLDLFRDHFKTLPENLVIYLDVCWGAFPAAASMVGGIVSKGQTGVPIVVGPLVAVRVDHSEKILAELRRTLENGVSLIAIRALAHTYNDNQRYRDCYGVDFIIGIHQPDGTFYPPDAMNQLAAPVQAKEFFVIESFRSHNGLANVHCVLRSQKNQIEYITSTACLLIPGELNISLSEFDTIPYMQRVVGSKYQIVDESPERMGYRVIVLNNPKFEKPRNQDGTVAFRSPAVNVAAADTET
ncbi:MULTISPECIES: hypothetical protein [unclassified Janthinobacterium]|uniref:hypothetical protein n=1 Tax=unclassified Janthinobacterium TaxID=2610881 RepID=UPI000C11527C|nr:MULTISPECIES: hypothetical protein [unclassified Janthinobacterium]MDZ5634250.1 hypothetical protein [Janthinobacterium sp. GMG1]PHV26369.1 hypothetical protein CSQ93_19975 [Janthinobacterium sp. BJB426]